MFPVGFNSIAKAQTELKQNFDARSRKPLSRSCAGDYVFLRKEDVIPEKERLHELSPIASGPYPEVSVQKDTVVLEIDN